MSIHVNWLAADSNIITLTVDGPWTWSEFYTARDQMYEMMEGSDYEHIDYILDLRNAPVLPANILSQMRNVGQRHHPKSRHMVAVGANRFIQAMFDVMKRIAPDRMQNVTLMQTLDEAVAMLKSRFEMTN